MSVVVAVYAVHPERRNDLAAVLAGHWPTLRRLGLVTDRPVELLEGIDRSDGQPVIVEIFEWVNDEAARVAHEHPEVGVIWEAITPLTRDGDDSPHLLLLSPLRL